MTDSVFGETISTYSRAEAIEDGVLIDVSETAKEAGIRYPVAVTAQLWNDYVTPDPRPKGWGQSIAGRLWDLMVCFRAQAGRTKGARFNFQVMFILKERQRRNVWVKAICGPGDCPEPVITLMLPTED